MKIIILVPPYKFEFLCHICSATVLELRAKISTNVVLLLFFRQFTVSLEFSTMDYQSCWKLSNNFKRPISITQICFYMLVFCLFILLDNIEWSPFSKFGHFLGPICDRLVNKLILHIVLQVNFKCVYFTIKNRP